MRNYFANFNPWSWVIFIFPALFLLSLYNLFIRDPAPFHPVSYTIWIVGLFLAFLGSLFNYYKSTRGDSEILLVLKIVMSAVTTITTYAAGYRDLGVVHLGEVYRESVTALYFSMVTWTTLGYGDFEPLPQGRIFAASEALLGYVYMGIILSVIVYIFQKEESKIEERVEHEEEVEKV